MAGDTIIPMEIIPTLTCHVIFLDKDDFGIFAKICCILDWFERNCLCGNNINSTPLTPIVYNLYYKGHNKLYYKLIVAREFGHPRRI